MEIQHDVSINGFATENQFTYFMYKEQCEDCRIVISLSSYHNGELDVYVNKKPTLPDLEEYDFYMSTLQSEIIVLESGLQFINNQTMKGTYVFGIYSEKNTTFQIIVQSEKDYIGSILDGSPLKIQQRSNFNMNFQYYHLANLSIEISLHISSGEADLYVTTFRQKGDILKPFLPRNALEAKWSSEKINSMNQLQGKEINITLDDSKFCTDCYYVMVILTRDQAATYTLSVNTLDQNQTYSNLIRIGQPKSIRLNGVNATKTFHFMVETKELIQIVPTRIAGDFTIYLCLDNNKSTQIEKIEQPETIRITPELIDTDEEYYIIVESRSQNAELTILLQQKLSLISLQEGIPQLVHYSSFHDSQKFLIYSLPKGSSSVIINVKSKTQGFFPILYTSFYEHKESSEIVFPPSDVVPYTQTNEKDWDTDLFLMRKVLSFNASDELSGIAINLKYFSFLMENFGKQMTDPSETSAEAIITVTHAKIAKLVPGEEFYGQIDNFRDEAMLFKLEQPRGTFVKISFSSCVGMADFSVITDLNNVFKSALNLNKHVINGMTVTFLKESEDKDYYLMVRALQYNQSFEVKNSSLAVEFMVMIEYTDTISLSQKDTYQPLSQGKLSYEYMRGRKGEVKLTWPPVYHFSSAGEGEEMGGVVYKLVFSNNPNAVMDQVCAIKKRYDVFSIYEQIDGVHEYVTALPPGEDTQFNVIAFIPSKQVVIPYKPVNLKVPQFAVYGSSSILILIGIIALVFGILAIYFYCKGRNLRKRLYEEIREVSTENSDKTTYRKVQGVNN